ncbi:unnamed protein product [Cuscuta epithymum]|uniref:Siah interacting protein N-terminal domain-containing protein n=1 Tax=Cuscuta epithymum TaxID=186058 RepID=A0AAV0E653_9ASTE|nr:unnamed protein product [Cuscuta epithymum]CAH9117915.1 unnamed protein product [Cuscuta epithymum]CAH9142283.1 unnamed protein product [Cuscuta epithymum]
MAESDRAKELALELDELKPLHRIATRPRVLSLIASEIRNIEKRSNDDKIHP